MRTLSANTPKDLVSPEVLLTLQLYTGNEPLLPRLRNFGCANPTGDFTPFIPLFLSPRTTDICINFINSPTIMVGLAIARFPKFCPHIGSLILKPLLRNPAITEAVSEMLLTCNRDTLQSFLVDSPVTEDARGVLYKLPKLRQFWTVIQGPTSLPTVALPDLETIHVEWDSGHNWLQGFHGATVGKLKTVTFRSVSESPPIGGFLEEFQSVALTTSMPNTLSEFNFYTSQPWTPNYSSLLIFKQMKKLEIEFSCSYGCRSAADDEVVINLAKAMPELEVLQLGKQPCRVSRGVTFKGLIVLALCCPRLSKLCVHFQANELAEAMSRSGPPSPSGPTAIAPQTNCALTDLQVGETPISNSATLAVGLTLLQIFPEILNIKYVGSNAQWGRVAETIRVFKRICGHIHHASKTHLPSPRRPLVMPYQKIQLCRNTVESDQAWGHLVLSCMYNIYSCIPGRHIE